MPTIAAIDPVTRIGGHLKILVKIDTVNGVQQVIDARAAGTLFRGFESILVNRDPRDAQHITERICGVCPVSHGMAAVMALDSAAQVTIPENARIMRNLVLGANFIHSHILHFYHLSLPDYLDGPNMPPWQPSWKADKRMSDIATKSLVANYLTALDMLRKAHEMGALFGGRMPSPPAFISGGFTTTPRPDRIANFKKYLALLIPFITDTYLSDVETIATAYADYSGIGAGVGNLLAYGAFALDKTGATQLFKRGRIAKGTPGVQDVDPTAIAEHVTHSWYADSTNNLHPSAGDTQPQRPKDNAYSWLKAPRYLDLPYESGPLARMTVNGDYTGGISVLDRHRARAKEALKVAKALQDWVGQLHPDQPVYTQPTLPAAATTSGLTEAPRGAIGHWLQITDGKIARYQIVTPTCWNASPRDSNDKRGPIEEALVGTPVKDIAEPVEVVRVIHSFDPCLACAVHVMRPAEDAKIIALGHYHGEDQVAAHAPIIMRKPNEM